MIFFPVILRSTVIPRFIATMMTLPSASRLATFLRWQIACVHGTFLAWYTTTPPPPPSLPRHRFRISRRGLVRGRTKATPVASRLALC